MAVCFCRLTQWKLDFFISINKIESTCEKSLKKLIKTIHQTNRSKTSVWFSINEIGSTTLFCSIQYSSCRSKSITKSVKQKEEEEKNGTAAVAAAATILLRYTN